MRSPECKLCLFAAAVAALVLAGAGLLGWASRQVSAAPGVTFEPCSIKTCAKVGEAVTDALGSVGPITIQAEDVAGVSGVPGCPKCSHVTLKGSGRIQMLNVIGEPKDVACALFGGDSCKSSSH